MTAHLLISGYVQGVFFRAETKKVADLLHLKGWVKNLSSGEVEVYAIGPTKNLEKLIKWCQQGPTAARVENVRVEWDSHLGSYTSFRIIE